LELPGDFILEELEDIGIDSVENQTNELPVRRTTGPSTFWRTRSAVSGTVAFAWLQQRRSG
jgi:hypothetical protein